MAVTTFSDNHQQRKAVKAERSSELTKVKGLIGELVPNGSYAEYLDISERLSELELFWALTRMKLHRILFCFRTTIKSLRKDPNFIHGDFLASELDKAEPKDFMGFTRRIDEVGAILIEKKKVYTQHSEINECLQNIARLTAEEKTIKLNMNSTYGETY